MYPLSVQLANDFCGEIHHSTKQYRQLESFSCWLTTFAIDVTSEKFPYSTYSRILPQHAEPFSTIYTNKRLVEWIHQVEELSLYFS